LSFCAQCPAAFRTGSATNQNQSRAGPSKRYGFDFPAKLAAGSGARLLPAKKFPIFQGFARPRGMVWALQIRKQGARKTMNMITPKDLHTLARRLINRHGPIAVTYADQAVSELEASGEQERADAWRALRSVVIDVLEGRLRSGNITIH
jgi:hypothetical protein